MKHLVIISFIFLNILNADSLLIYNYKNKVYTKCIKEYSFYEYRNKPYIDFIESDNSQNSLVLSTLKSYEILDGYEYKNYECQLQNDLKISGMSNEQYTLMMLILANFTGLSIVLPFSILIVRS